MRKVPGWVVGWIRQKRLGLGSPTRNSPREDADRQPELEVLAGLSFVLESAIRIPGTRWRIGIDGLVGLVPGLGDVLGSLIGAYSLWIARRLGAPIAIQARMVMNLAIDAMIGLVPLAGDLFDFAFRAHTRNYELLSTWLATPRRTQRTSWLILAAGMTVLIGLLGGAAWIGARVVQWLLSWVMSTDQW